MVKPITRLITKKGKAGISHGKEVETPLVFNAPVDGLKLAPELALHPIPQDEAGNETGQGGADGAREGDHNGSHQKPEQCTACKGQDRGTGQGQGGYGNINDHIGAHHRYLVPGIHCGKGFLG